MIGLTLLITTAAFGCLLMLWQVHTVSRQRDLAKKQTQFSTDAARVTSDLLGVCIRSLQASRLENLGLKHELAERDIELSRYKRKEQEHKEATARG